LMFPVADAAQAADCIARLLDDNLRRRLGARALELLESRYSRPHSVEAWSRCIESVLSSAVRTCAAETLPVQPAGRLDRCFGTRFGERLRRAAGIKYRHTEPGGEWPHSYGCTPVGDSEFWQQAAALDSRSP
jgi:hypothetical protein